MSLPRNPVRIIVTLILLSLCVYVIRLTGRAGLSRLYSTAAIKGSMMPGANADGLVAAAEDSLRLAPLDPEARRARGIAKLSQGKPAEATDEFAHAASLRPRHYLLWMDVGRARDQTDDVTGAIQAFREAVRLAPYFAQPRWQLANVLFRAEKYDEAFPELRRAIAGDPSLLPLSMELAWAGSRGDARTFMQMIEPQGASQRLIVGRFLAKHGKAREAVELFHNAGGIAEADQRALVGELINARQFPEAYEVWVSGREGVDSTNRGIAAITDGGFENRIVRDDPGFGWRVNTEVATFRVTLDADAKNEGARSLRMEWNGESNPTSQLVTQIVMVEPKSSYRLTFRAHARGLVTGGLPVVVLSDASSEKYTVLGESEMISEGDQDWSEYKVDFKTGEKSNAVLISLQRRPCATAQCPIFGRVWLDGFVMAKG